ncbi:MAG: RNA methyltransferase [Verrucomicrobiota bacterium]
MEPLFIQSPANQRIKALTKLWNRKEREAQTTFLIEGLRELTHAVQNGVGVGSIYYCPDLFKSEQHQAFMQIAESEPSVERVRLSSEAFKKLSYREGPDGLIGQADMHYFDIDEINPPPNPLFLVVDGVEKPGNLGAIIRSADAAGVDAIFCCDLKTDIFNPNVIRSSQGLIFAMPVVVAESANVLDFMQHVGVITHATTPDGSKRFWDIDFSGPSAIVMGAEDTGLTDFWLKSADTRAVIPMHGAADSLNVNAAAVVTLFEAARQRNLA